jgi:phage protein D
MLARRAKLILLYNGADISEDISADLDTATWTDKSSGEADEINVNLHNTHGKWSNEWLPSKGAKLTASIEVQNWDGEGDAAILPCGAFEIDQINVSGGDGSSKVTIKGLSAPVTSKVRGNKKTKAWNDMKLSLIAAEIARNAGLALYLELENDPVYQREDQVEETDLGFLQGLCSDAGANLKVSHDKIVIFDQGKREAEEAVLAFTPEMVATWSFSSKSNKVYKTAKVEYHDPETDEDFSFDFDGDLANLSGADENDRVLVLNKRVKSQAEAETLAKNSLRENNKSEVTGSFSCVGDIRLVAGVNVQMQGFGKFDGKYVIDTAAHSIGNKYGASVQIRRALGAEGRKKAKAKSVPWADVSKYEWINKEGTGAYR